MSFHYIMLSPSNERNLITLVDIFMKRSTIPDIDFQHPVLEPLLFLCLGKHPRAADLVKQLCGFGCYVDREIKCELDEDRESGPEDVNDLLWAICQPERKVSTSVINALIEASGTYVG